MRIAISLITALLVLSQALPPAKVAAEPVSTPQSADRGPTPGRGLPSAPITPELPSEPDEPGEEENAAPQADSDTDSATPSPAAPSPTGGSGSQRPASSIGNDLPNIGSPADSVWTQEEEYQIGRMVMKSLRDAGQLVEDPEINEYLQSLGQRLASHTEIDGQRFSFFAVKGSDINAFAVPGGYIGVNAGLLLATKNESELAGVVAHEIAHVTQRHMARGVKAQSRSALVSAAAMLAAVLMGAAGGGGDAVMGAIAMSQGAALQTQLNYTRAHEYEADRIGMSTLAGAGFDPQGMPDFFETMSRRYGNSPGQLPELLRTHPLNANRVAEARSRVREYGSRSVTDTASYALSRERMRVLTIPAEQDPAAYYKKIISSEKQASEKQASEKQEDDSHRYGRALSLMASNQPKEAIALLEKLSRERPAIIQYRSAHGQALMQADRVQDALQVFAQAMQLFPRNVALTMRYGEVLMRADQAAIAHRILLDLFNAVPPTPEQARFIALCANAAGDVADAYSYMAEYHIMSGELKLAIDQLQAALAVPNLSNVQQARFQARMDELREYLPKGERRMARRGPGEDESDRRRRP